MAKKTKASAEVEAADPTIRIPMTSPRGHRTKFVSTQEAERLAEQGWRRETRDLWS